MAVNSSTPVKTSTDIPTDMGSLVEESQLVASTSGDSSSDKSPAQSQGFLRNPFILAVIIALAAAGLSLSVGSRPFPEELRIPFGTWISTAFDQFSDNGGWLYEPAGHLLSGAFDSLSFYLSQISPPVLATAIVLAVWYMRGWALAGLTGVLFAWVVLGGLWEATVDTLAFMTVSVAVSALLGVLIGLIASTSQKSAVATKATLDVMQSFPAFAYFIPLIALFGMGNTAALIVTVIWALPPIARMTTVGLRGVSPETLEAAESTGLSRRGLLWNVKLPMARESINAGLNQTIMYAVGMATMAAMIGAAGLGAPVWGGLNRLAFGDALQAGIALVLLAIIMDRFAAPRKVPARPSLSRSAGRSQFDLLARLLSHRRLLVSLAVLSPVILASILSRGAWQNFDSPPWGTPLSLRGPVDQLVGWLTIEWGPGLNAAGGIVQQMGLNTVGSLLSSIPWFVALAALTLVSWIFLGGSAAVLTSLGVLTIGLFGTWESAVETLAVVLVAVGLVVLLGFPIGVLMSASDRLSAMIRPVLDITQSMPIYLFAIPAVLIFGSGQVSAVLATFLAAFPPLVRFTNAGLRTVDREVVEAALTFGASRFQVFRKVRVPLSIQTILVGLNQTVLLALAMAVVSAFIGSPGLGEEIYTSVMLIDLASGVEAGLAMCLIAIIIDRLFGGIGQQLTKTTSTLSKEGNMS